MSKSERFLISTICVLSFQVRRAPVYHKEAKFECILLLPDFIIINFLLQNHTQKVKTSLFFYEVLHKIRK